MSVHSGAQQPQSVKGKQSVPGAQQPQAHGNGEIVTHLNNLNRLEDIEPLDLHWRSTRLRDLIGADRSEQIEHNRGIRTS